MITGSIYIDLSDEGDIIFDNRDRNALVVLEQCPDGAHVVVDIGGRKFVTEDAARWLHAHDHRLQVDIRGRRPDAVLRFVTAARAGTWSVVA